jgi:hypothetical protein
LGNCPTDWNDISSYYWYSMGRSLVNSTAFWECEE